MPPLDADAGADVVVIGGGYTGLWTAWWLAESGAKREHRRAGGRRLRTRPERTQRRLRQLDVVQRPRDGGAVRDRGCDRGGAGGARGRARDRTLVRGKRRRCLVPARRLPPGLDDAAPRRRLGRVRARGSRVRGTRGVRLAGRRGAEGALRLAAVSRRSVLPGRRDGAAGAARERAARPARQRGRDRASVPACTPSTPRHPRPRRDRRRSTWSPAARCSPWARARRPFLRSAAI